MYHNETKISNFCTFHGQKKTRMANPDFSTGRINQKKRTREALLKAARRLLQQQKSLTIEAVAQEALVSRATAYRYFSDVDVLAQEAVISTGLPEVEHILNQLPPGSPAERLARCQELTWDLNERMEPEFRKFLSLAVLKNINPASSQELRGNRRQELIARILEPIKENYKAETYRNLELSLCVFVFSIEALLVMKDVCRLDGQEGKAVINWAVRCLLKGSKRMEEAGN